MPLWAEICPKVTDPNQKDDAGGRIRTFEGAEPEDFPGCIRLGNVRLLSPPRLTASLLLREYLFFYALGKTSGGKSEAQKARFLTASLLMRENRCFTLAGVANLEPQFKYFATPAKDFLRLFLG